MSNDLADRLKRAAPAPARTITAEQLARQASRHHRLQALGGGCVALLVVAGALVGVLSSGGGGSDQAIVATVSSPPTPTSAAATTPQVSVSPTTHLIDGQTVVVRGSGFTPQTQVAMVTCAAESNTLANKQDACAITQVQYAVVDQRGDLVTSYVLQRAISTAKTGTIDCGSRPERCRLGIGEVSTQKGASVLLTFTTSATATKPPTLKLDVVHGIHTPLHPEVSGSGFVAGRQVVLRQCLTNSDCGASPILATVTTNGLGEFTTGLTLQTTIHLVTGDEVWCALHCKLVASMQPDSFAVVASTPELSLWSLAPIAKQCDLATVLPSYAGWQTLTNGDRALTINLRNTAGSTCSLLGYPSVQATKASKVVSSQSLVGSDNGIILEPGTAAQFRVVTNNCDTETGPFDALNLGLFGESTQRTVSVPAPPANRTSRACYESGVQNLQVGPFTTVPR